MRKWYTPALAVVGSALLAVPLLAFALPDEKEDDKDKTSAQRELKELEAQRDKIDSRIRELRKKSGLPGANAWVIGDGKLQELHALKGLEGLKALEGVKGLEGEHAIVIQKAIGEAHKAVAEAMKNLPKDFHKFEFDPEQHSNFKLFIDKDGKQFKYDNKMSDEEKKKFKEQMEKMGIQIRESLKGLKDLKVYTPELKALKDFKVYTPDVKVWTDENKIVRPKIVTPEYRVIEPKIRTRGEDSELRDEIRSLREEVQKLRDEVKKGRGGSRNDLDRFDNANFL